MTTWTSDELDAIAAAVRTADRTAQAGRHAARAVPIWIVRHRADLYVRSYRGGGAAWYRVGRFLGPSISVHYRRHPLDDHIAAWRAAGLTDIGVSVMSLGGGLVMWGRKAAPPAGPGS